MSAQPALAPEISPADMEANIKELAKEDAEMFEAFLQDLIDNGMAMFKRQPLTARYEAYMRIPVMPMAPVLDEMGNTIQPGNPGQPCPGTFPDEVLMVLSDGYDDMVRSGRLPQPRSPMWRMLFSLPPMVTKHYLADFRLCYRTVTRREEETFQGFVND